MSASMAMDSSPSRHRPGGYPSEGRRSDIRRVTFVIPAELDNLLEIYCVASSEKKNDITSRAIQEFLGQRRESLHKALEASSNAIRRLVPQAEKPDVAPTIALPSAGLTIGVFGESPEDSRIKVVGTIAGDLVRRLLRSQEEMYNLTPQQFEELIMDRVAAMGCEIEQAGKTNQPDGGIDFVFWPRVGNGPTFLGAVQVKHHATRRRKSGVEVVHSMAGILQRHHGTFNLGMVVTNTSFTKEAHWFVDPFKLFVRLRDGADVLRWVEDDFSNEQELREFPPSIQLTSKFALKLKKPK
jgi:hypothetical protein